MHILRNPIQIKQIQWVHSEITETRPMHCGIRRLYSPV